MTSEQLARDFAVRHPLPVWHDAIKVCDSRRPDGIPKLHQAIREQSDLQPRILALVNSSLYAFPSPIIDLPMATTVVGPAALLDLLLALAVADAVREVAPRTLNRESFWHHALGSGVIARSRGRQTPTVDGEILFLAGMLHDIGKLVIHLGLPEQSRELKGYLDRADARAFTEEQALLGFNHTHTGSALLRAWSMPQATIDAAAGHHAQSTNPVVNVIAMADRLAPPLEPPAPTGDESVAPGYDSRLLETELQAVELQELLFG